MTTATIAQQQIGLLQLLQTARKDLFAVLTDDDLAYRLPGQNESLGEHLRALGEITHSYIDTYATGKQDFSWRHDDPTVATSLARLSAWFDQLDQQYMGVVSSLSDDDMQTRTFERIQNALPLRSLIDVFQQAAIIQFAKISVYLRALNKPLPGFWSIMVG